jgi:hypothetical protein
VAGLICARVLVIVSSTTRAGRWHFGIVLPVVARRRVPRQQQTNVEGVALELPVRERSLLKRAEACDPVVRLTENAQPEHAHRDQERCSANDRDEQLGVDLRREAADRTDESAVAAARPASFLDAVCSTVRRRTIGQELRE